MFYHFYCVFFYIISYYIRSFLAVGMFKGHLHNLLFVVLLLPLLPLLTTSSPTNLVWAARTPFLYQEHPPDEDYQVGNLLVKAPLRFCSFLRYGHKRNECHCWNAKLILFLLFSYRVFQKKVPTFVFLISRLPKHLERCFCTFFNSPAFVEIKNNNIYI